MPTLQGKKNKTLLQYDGVGGRQYGPRKECFCGSCSLWVAETPGPVGRHILSFISTPDGIWRSKVRLFAAVMLLMSVGLCHREIGSLLLITVSIKLECSRLKFLPLAAQDL